MVSIYTNQLVVPLTSILRHGSEMPRLSDTNRARVRGMQMLFIYFI